MMTIKAGAIKTATAILAMMWLAGCAEAPQRDRSFGPTPPAPQAPNTRTEGAIYQAGQELSLFEDVKARRVGDVLTIVLVEKTNANKKANTNTKKKNTVDLPNPTLFGAPFSTNIPGTKRDINLATDVKSNQEFSGEGDSSQSNSLTGNVTVTVAEVWPNGNLFVKGEKQLTMNQGSEYVQFSGIVRTADIRPDNSVLSTQVADAKIAYAGEGTLADTNSMGWLGRFFNGKWWPF